MRWGKRAPTGVVWLWLGGVRVRKDRENGIYTKAYMCVCAYVCVSASVHVCVLESSCSFVCLYEYMFTCVHISEDSGVCTYACVHMCVARCTCVCTRRFMFVRLCIRV